MEKHETLTLPVPLVDLLVSGIEQVPVVECAGRLVYRQEVPYAWLVLTRDGRSYPYTPCLDWRLGGPLIQKHEISFHKLEERWHADIRGRHAAQGKTPLIACMRTLLHRHFGDTVMVNVPTGQGAP